MADFVAPEAPITESNFVAPEQGIGSPPYSPETPNEPGLQDVSVPDAMMVQGLGGLAKAGAGLGMRGVGAALEAIPATENIVPTIENTSNDLLLKGLGARGMQIKSMGGLEKARDAADVAREAGMGKVFSTELGRKAALEDTIAEHGKEIGALRKQAGTASPGIMDQVKQDLMAKYNPANADVLSKEAPQVQKGLNTIQGMGRPPVGPALPQTNAQIAQGITKLNQFATGAKQLQPVNALTDVANSASAANNADIAQKLGSDEALKYIKALHNESGAFKLQQPLERGAERLAVGGQQGGTLANMAKKVMNMGGYRATSQGLNALHGALTAPMDLTNIPPAAAKSLLAYLSQKENQ
jgi:hypothetical protein